MDDRGSLGVRFCLTWLLFLVLGGLAQAQEDWPQWRGPGGMALSSAPNLPDQMGPESDSLLWRVRVAGEGISSPIVSTGRVFLTSAYAGELSPKTTALRWTILLLALWILIVGPLFRFKSSPIPRSGFVGKLLLADRVLVNLGSLGFLGILFLVNNQSHPLVSDSLETLLGRSRLWERGSPGEAWLITGLIALTGGALAIGWWRPASIFRLLGSLALLGLAVPLWLKLPLNMYADPYNTQYVLIMVSPALAGALWHVSLYLACRSGPLQPGAWLGTTVAWSLIFLAGLGFALQNHFAQSAGLVRAVLCYDLETGEELWNTKLFIAPESKKYPRNSYATPTACADDKMVFADFGSGYACLDHDGNVLWMKRNEAFDGFTRYGSSTSPVLNGERIILLHDKEIDLGPSYLMALEKQSGELLWRKETWKSHDSYTTPLLMERQGETQLISVSFDRLNGHDPSNGDLLWSLDIPIQQMVPSLQYRGDLLLISGGSHLKFATMGIRLSGLGQQTQAEILWSTRRAIPNISSPVWIGDYFFTVTDGGIMTCYDPESGTVHWKERLGGTYWASLVAGGGKVYALSDAGKLVTIRAGSTFEVLSEGMFDEACYATPAIAQGKVIVRTKDYLYAFASNGS